MEDTPVIEQPQAAPVTDKAPVQQPPQGGAEKLYNNLLKDGYTEKNLGSKDDFVKRVQNPIEANKLYSALRVDGYTQDNLGDMVTFRNRLVEKKSPVGSGAGFSPSRIGSNSFQVSPEPTDTRDYSMVTDPELKKKLQTDDKNAFTDKDRATLDDMHQKVQAQNRAAKTAQSLSALKPITTKPKMGGPETEIEYNRIKDLKGYGTTQKNSWWNLPDFTASTVVSSLTKDAGQLADFIGHHTNDPENQFAYSELAQKLDGISQEQQQQAENKSLPNTTAGRVTSGAIGFVPDLIELAATPELELGKAGELIAKYGGKYALKGAEIATGKFPTLLAAKGLISGYDAAKANGADDWQAWKQAFADAGKGYSEGALYEGAGRLAGKASKVGSKVLTDAGLMAGNKVVAGAEKALLNSTAQAATFSMVPFVSNAVQGKATTLDELKDNAIFGGVLGLFHVPGEDKADVTPADVASKEIIDRSPAIDLHNFLTADPDAIESVHNMPVEPADLQAKAAAHAQQAFIEEDPEIKQQHIVQSSVSGKMASVKAIANTILENKNDLIDGINELPISDEVKQQVIAKIEEVNQRINPAEQEKKALGSQIQQLDDAIATNQQRMESPDPVEKADAEVVDERLNKEKTGLETQLKKTISNEYERQGKASEELQKEREQAQQAAQDVVPEKPEQAPAEKVDEKPAATITDEKAVADKAKELKAKANATNAKLKEQKADIIDQMQEVHDALGGDPDNTEAIEKAGYEVDPDGRVVFHVKDDGVFKVHKDWFVGTEGIDQIKKEFPERIDKAPQSKVTPTPKRSTERQLAENRPNLEATETRLQNAKDNLAEAKRLKDEKMAKVWQDEVDREQKVYDIAKHIDYKSIDKPTEKPQETTQVPQEKPSEEPVKAEKEPQESTSDTQKPKGKVVDDALIQPSKLKGSKYDLVLAETPEGKFGIVDKNSGVTVSNLYDDAASARLAYAKSREKLTPQMIDEGIKRLKGDVRSGYVMAPFVNEFIEHDIKPAVQKIANTFGDGLKSLVNTLSPKTGVSLNALDTITKHLNSRNEANTAVDKALGSIEKMFDKMPDTQRIDFIDHIKRGEKQATPELQQIADAYKQMDKDLYDEVSKFKESLPFRENHFRVLWKTVPGTEKPRSWFGRAKRPLEGSKGFLKKATLADMSEGIARGGVPLSTNPITLYKAAYEDAMKFVTAHRMFDALKEDGVIKFVKTGGEVPEGFVPIDDKIARVYFPVQEGLVKAGEWHVEKNAGRIINNFLSKDYIRDNAIGRGLMNIKNAYTAAELGLSAYHASAIALEGISSDIGRGFRKLVNLGLRGDFRSAGEGITDILKAPFSPKTTFSLGRKFIKFATQKDFETSEFGKKFLKQNPEAAQYVHDLFMGGGLLKQSSDLKANTYKSLKEQAGKQNYIGAALRALPALNEIVMSPLFDHYIPAMKVGMFMKEFPLSLKENQARIDKGLTTRAEVARKTVNFIDDRLGEMNFDNLFWNRTFKTGMQLMLRSVTWKLGNLRAMGGAPVEQAMEFYNAAREGRAPNLSPKMAWLMGLATMQVALATTTQYLFTGTYPQTIKDLIAPRLSNDDNKDRMVLPTYTKDVTHLYYKGTRDYIASSLSGDVSKIADIWSNSDFQKYQIYSPDEPVTENAKDVGLYVLPKPISFSALQQSIKKGEPASRMAMSFFGFNKAPKYLTNPPIENKIFDLYTMHEGVKSKGQKEANELKDQIKTLYKQGKDDDAEKLINDALESGKLKFSQVKYLNREIGKEGDAATYFFNELPDDDKVYLYKQMTDDERATYDPKGKVGNLVRQQEEYQKEQEAKKKKDKPFSMFDK